MLEPWEAALLAGMVANPSAFDPIAHPQAGLGRRDLVLRDMFEQRYITRAQYEQGIGAAAARRPHDLQQPQEPAAAPYFTSWLRPQIIARAGTRRASRPAGRRSTAPTTAA